MFQAFPEPFYNQRLRIRHRSFLLLYLKAASDADNLHCSSLNSRDAYEPLQDYLRTHLCTSSFQVNHYSDTSLDCSLFPCQDSSMMKIFLYKNLKLPNKAEENTYPDFDTAQNTAILTHHNVFQIYSYTRLSSFFHCIFHPLSYLSSIYRSIIKLFCDSNFALE